MHCDSAMKFNFWGKAVASEALPSQNETLLKSAGLTFIHMDFYSDEVFGSQLHFCFNWNDIFWSQLTRLLKRLTAPTEFITVQHSICNLHFQQRWFLMRTCCVCTVFCSANKTCWMDFLYIKIFSSVNLVGPQYVSKHVLATSENLFPMSTACIRHLLQLCWTSSITCPAWQN